MSEQAQDFSWISLSSFGHLGHARISFDNLSRPFWNYSGGNWTILDVLSGLKLKLAQKLELLVMSFRLELKLL